MLRQGVQGISDLITVPGLINLDFADVRAIMTDAGSALMGIGRASGADRAAEAARQAIGSPLLEINIPGAQGVLFNITGGPGLGLFEVDEAAEIIRETADQEANIIFGTVIDERMGDEVLDHGHRDRASTRAASATSTASPATSEPTVAVGLANRDYMRELEQQRRRRPSRSWRPTTMQLHPSDGAEMPEPVAVGAPRSTRCAPPRVPRRRAGPPEVEDLDIPAFLRRSR